MKIIKNHYIVHKFGGSSLASAKRFSRVKDILNSKKAIIVVSAIKGTTNTLQRALDIAKSGKDFSRYLSKLEEVHTKVIRALIPKSNLFTQLKEDFSFIQSTLTTIKATKFYAKETQDFILGFGEIWSAKIMAEYLGLEKKVLYVDASKVIYCYVNNNMACIDWEKSESDLKKYLAKKDWDSLVITGFIAKTLDGRRTILGRNSSDYSGAIFARLFKAKSLYIWTDVDGIYTAHPKKVPAAVIIKNLTYKEAHELAVFGAGILHPATILPLELENIPIYIKNSYNPSAPGTRIAKTTKKTKSLIKGISCISDIALINIEGLGMSGVTGLSSRIFQVLEKANISAIFVSQASSESSVCFAVNKQFVNLASKMLKEDLAFEIKANIINKISANKSCAIIAVVGEGMAGKADIAAKVCQELAGANINIGAITQGTSEINISIIINNNDEIPALNTLHLGFNLAARVAIA